MKYVKEIKSTITGAHEFTDEDAITYKVKILGRGEELFFQKGDDALICISYSIWHNPKISN